jgi:hypothetical protein
LWCGLFPWAALCFQEIKNIKRSGNDYPKLNMNDDIKNNDKKWYRKEEQKFTKIL